MVDWRNEISGQVTGPVVQAGSIDHVTLHVGPPQEQDLPPLTSWADRPALPSALRDLLEAQMQATGPLPYRLLGVKQPALTEVYVGQHVRTTPVERPPESDRKPPQEDRTERTLSITEALNSSGHLLITGEPGSGKSTVGYRYVRHIAELWLDEGHPGPPELAEPVLPLRIPARALVKDKAWSELLAAATEETLGGRLSLRPKPEVLVRRNLGARWLVFVDGLDEITEPEARAQLIATLAHQLRRNTDQRLVITTRQLPAAEVRPLVQAGVEIAEIKQFGRPELKKFADAWFRAQGAVDPESRADEFLSQARDSRLRDLLRNPLLATIAAIAKTLEPRRPLPNSRVSLYERFMTYLLDDHPGRRDSLAELRQSLATAPDRLELVEWAHQHRTDIIEHVAARRMDAESLLDATHEWVLARRHSLPATWRIDLAEVLAGTGVFTRTEEDLEFRHHSFAEFLAARHSARAIPPDFPNLGEWIERGLAAASRAYALFTFVLWGRDNDISHVLHTLLAGTKEKVLLAGRLLAEDIDTTPELAASVVERLVDLLLCTGARADSWDDTEEVGEVVGGLSAESLGSPVRTRFLAMRDDPYLAEAIRIECAVTLGKLGAPEEAAEWLARFAEDAGLRAVHRSTSALRDLVPEGMARAEEVLRRVAGRRDDHLTTMAVADLMLEHKMTDAAGRLVGALCARLRADPAVRPGADVPLPPTATRIADVLENSAVGWGVLADLAVRSGRLDDAGWAIALALATPTMPDEDFALAAAAAAACGRTADILSAAGDYPTEHLTAAAQKLHEHGHDRVAIDLARRVLTRTTIDGYSFFRAAFVLAECGAKAELVRIAVETTTLQAEHFAQLPMLLTGLGDVPPIVDRLRVALAEPLIDAFDFARIAEALLTSGDRAMAEHVYRLAAAQSPRHQTEAATILCRADHVDLGRGLIADMLAKGLRVDAISDLLGEGILGNEDIGMADDLLAAVTDALPDVSSFRYVDVSEGLARVGRTEEALAAARRAVRRNIDSTWLENSVEAWLAVGGAAAADEILAEILTRDISARYRLEVAGTFAEEGVLDAAVAVWLDVVRHHGDATGLGVEAASCLVRCGYRDRAIAALDTALTDDRLDRPTRTSLSALRAWVIA